MQTEILSFQIEWSQIREKGKLNYIFRYGVISWGLPAAIAFIIIFNIKSSWENLFLGIILITIIFSTGGLFIGLVNWYIKENIFTRTFK